MINNSIKTGQGGYNFGLGTGPSDSFLPSRDTGKIVTDPQGNIWYGSLVSWIKLNP